MQERLPEIQDQSAKRMENTSTNPISIKRVIEDQNARNEADLRNKMKHADQTIHKIRQAGKSRLMAQSEPAAD